MFPFSQGCGDLVPLICGTPETVASKIDAIVAKTGVPGTMLNGLDDVPGIGEF